MQTKMSYDDWKQQTPPEHEQDATECNCGKRKSIDSEMCEKCQDDFEEKEEITRIRQIEAVHSKIYSLSERIASKNAEVAEIETELANQTKILNNLIK